MAETNIGSSRGFEVTGDLPRYAVPFGGGTHNFAALGYGRARRVIALADSEFSDIKYAVKKNGSNLVIATPFIMPAGIPLECAGILEITTTEPILAHFD